jgi:hypothetical protein
MSDDESYEYDDDQEDEGSDFQYSDDDGEQANDGQVALGKRVVSDFGTDYFAC